MRFSLATATAAALPFLLTLTTTAAEPQKVVEAASSIPSSVETMVISTPLVIARQKANLAPALPPPSSPPSAGLRGTNSPTEGGIASTAASVEAVSVIQDKWENEFWNIFYSTGDGDRNQIR